MRRPARGGRELDELVRELAQLVDRREEAFALALDLLGLGDAGGEVGFGFLWAGEFDAP